MAGPTLQNVSAGDFPDAPEWFRRYLDVVNPFIGDTTNTLTGNLGPQNFRRQIETFRVDTEAAVSSTFSSGKVQIKNKLGIKPKEVRIGQIYPVGSSTLTEDAWHAPTLAGTWVNFGGNDEEAGYLKDALGFVHSRGLVKDGAAAPSTIFTLPTGYRPAKRHIFTIATSAGLKGEVHVTSAGLVSLDAGNTGYVSLAGITFRADDSTSTAPVAWDLQQNGLIRINWISGLAPSKSYDITLVIE